MLQKQSATSPFLIALNRYIYLLFIRFYLFTFLYKSFLCSDFTIIMHNYTCYNIEELKNIIIPVKIRTKEEV